MERKRIAALILLLSLLLPACGRKPRVQLPPPIPARVGATETGMASWYGHPYHGRRTSNGEIYDMNELTAAHLRLPFGTIVRVTNLDNSRSVEVRINDRGPFVKNRLIDLSREAARRIAMVGPGTARVRVEVAAAPQAPVPELAEIPELTEARIQAALEPPPCASGSYRAVQVGAFRDLENAQRMRGRMHALYGVARIHPARVDGETLYRVLVGEGEDVEALLARITADRYDAFVQAVGPDEAASCREVSQNGAQLDVAASELEQLAQPLRLRPTHRNLRLRLVAHPQLVARLEPGHDFFDAVDVH